MDKAIIVTSGGLDSTTNGLMMLKKGYECTFLHFDYHQKCEIGEVLSVKKIVETLKNLGYPVSFELVEVPFFSKVGSSSSLVSNDYPVHPGMESIQLSSGDIGDIWVPARNVVFLSIASAYAEEIGVKFITLGCNQSEIGYPDNTKEFLDRFTYMLKMGTIKCHPKVISPEWKFDKVGLVKWGYDHGFGKIYGYTWSSDDKPVVRGMVAPNEGLIQDRTEIMTSGTDGCSMNRRMAFFILELKYGNKYPDRQVYQDTDYFEHEFLTKVRYSLDNKKFWWYKYRELLLNYFLMIK